MYDALNDGGSRKITHGVTKTGGARGAAHDETIRKPNATKPTTRHGATKSERDWHRAKARAPPSAALEGAGGKFSERL